jgi:bla regulator protein blaR1
MSIAENISHPFVSALGWSVLHSLWQFLIIALLIRLALELSKRSSSGLRYWLSLAGLLAIPLTFVATFIRQWNIYTGAKKVVSLQFEDAAWHVAGGDTGFYMVDKRYPGFLDRFEAFMPVVFWIYVVGLLLFSLHGIFSYYRVYTLRTTGVEALPAMWKSRIALLAKKAGVKGRVPIQLSKKVSIPVVAGFFKPVILLPLAMLTSLSPEQVETVLLHELRHIRNKDHYIIFIQNLLEILFFFHPATWWISRCLREERENRIDEWVVGNTGAPLIYAQALFSLESKRSSTLQPVLAATQSKNHLLLRIKNIMTMKTRPFKPGKNLAALAIIVAATLSLAWFDPTKSMNNYAFQDYADRVQYTADPIPGQAGPSPVITASSDLAQFPATVQASPQSTTEPNKQSTLEPNKQSTPASDKKPGKVVLNDGTTLHWEDLSEQDRQQILEAVREARLALAEVNQELVKKFNSEEFRMQMVQVQEETRQAGEEVRRAMEEMNRELNSEEFRMEMQKVGEEVRKAMEEVNSELHSEEFRMEMQKVGEEVRKAMEEIDWEVFGETMTITMEEVGKSMELIGPSVQEILEEIIKAMEESNQEKENPSRPDKEQP